MVIQLLSHARLCVVGHDKSIHWWGNRGVGDRKFCLLKTNLVEAPGDIS